MSEPATITYLAGVARSGTSWLGQIFDSSPEVRFSFQPLFAYEFKNRVHEDSSAEEFTQLLSDIYDTESPFLIQEDKRKSGDYPIFEKAAVTSHLALKENRYQYLIEPMMRKCHRVKLVGIIRNPNAALSSWMKNPKEFPSGSDPLKEWRLGNCKNMGHEDFFGYYKWKEVANLYLDLKEKWPDRVYILRYEDLVASPQEITRDLFEFCDLELSRQTKEFVHKSSNSHVESPYSVFKNKNVASMWETELNPYITDEISHDLARTRLERFIQD
jgi:Sulfotransferase family